LDTFTQLKDDLVKANPSIADLKLVPSPGSTQFFQFPSDLWPDFLCFVVDQPQFLYEVHITRTNTDQSASESSPSKWAIGHEELSFGPLVGDGRFGVVRSGVWRNAAVAIKEARAGPHGRAKLLTEYQTIANLRPHVCQQLYPRAFSTNPRLFFLQVYVCPILGISQTDNNMFIITPLYKCSLGMRPPHGEQ